MTLFQYHLITISPILHLKTCDQFDKNQKFVVTNGGRIKIAFKQTDCLYATGYSGRKAMMTTNRAYKCKAHI